MLKRIVLVVLAALLMLLGIALMIGGGVTAAITGSDNTLQSGSHRLTTGGTALVTPIGNISHTSGATDELGQPDLRIALSGARTPTFVGVAPTAAVDRYLSGAPIERVNDLQLDPFRLITTPVFGSARPAPPATQSFWVTQGSGIAPSLNWKISTGSYRLVIMNADAATGVSTDARVALRVPHLFAIGLSILIAGVVLTLLGVLLLVLGLRRPRPRHPVGYTAAPGVWAGPATPPQPGPPPQEGRSPAAKSWPGAE